MKFSELVDLVELRGLCESFTTITGAVTAIVDLEGNVLIATGWQDICTRFHRVNQLTMLRCRESDTVLAGKLHKQERFNIYRCRNGLVDVAVPITIRGEHLANFFTGQFFTEPPDKAYFLRQAEEFGFDSDAYLEALNRVPVFTEGTIQSMMDFFTRLAQLIGEMGLARHDLERANAELLRHQENLADLVMERTAELTVAKEAAEASNRAKSVFLANMSHELRTPLNAVLGFSRLLNNDRNATPEQKESLNIITRSGEHLLDLVNNVLDISKIEAGRVELEKADVDLHQLVHEMRSMMYVRAVEKGLSFIVEQAPDLPRYVTVDKNKLRQVLINLIGNAVKYTRIGGVLLRAGIVSKEREPQARVCFEVEDTGPGIPAEDRERIFHPFVQLNDRSTTEAGTGLGLAISKQFVDLMGGEIAIESKPGKGSVFHVEVPVELPSIKEIPATVWHRHIIGLAQGHPRYRLLIVEDQHENLLLMHKLLDPLGFELRDAANGREALEIFTEWHPDLIWMDIRMPVMDGMEAARRIKATPSGAHTKIIALTAHSMEEERHEILAAGCDDFVRKPYRGPEIFEVMARHLGLTYEYEDEPQPSPGYDLHPAHFAALPAALLGQLLAAVVELDTERTEELIGHVTALDAEAGWMLQGLAKNLEYDSLLMLLETAVAGAAAIPGGEDA